MSDVPQKPIPEHIQSLIREVSDVYAAAAEEANRKITDAFRFYGRSVIDAAVIVLTERGHAMDIEELLVAMKAGGLAMDITTGSPGGVDANIKRSLMHPLSRGRVLKYFGDKIGLIEWGGGGR